MSVQTTTSISLESRDGKGKKMARRLRREGWIPGVFYTHESRHEGALSVKIRTSEMIRILAVPGVTHHLLELDTPLGFRRGIIKNIQKNPCKEEIWHIDFYGVQADQKITITVPINLLGEAVGVEQGGVMEVVTSQVEVECLPDAIPEGIDIDISNLEIGSAVHVSDLVAPEGVEIKNDPEDVVVLVAAQRVMVEEEEIEEEEEEEGVEPTIVGEEEEEGGEEGEK